MLLHINRTDLERAVVAEGRQPPAMLPGEYAGRLWLRLAGVDPGGALDVPADDLADAVVLERARDILAHRSLGDPGAAAAVVEQLAAYRDVLTGR